jgi:hypothetical protein
MLLQLPSCALDIAAGRSNSEWVVSVTANTDWRFRHRGEYSPYHEDMRTTIGHAPAVWDWDPVTGPGLNRTTDVTQRKMLQVFTPWNMTRLPFSCPLCNQPRRYMRLADEMQLFPLYTEENCITVMTKQNYVPQSGNFSSMLEGRFIPPVYYDYWYKTLVNKSTVHSWGWDYNATNPKGSGPRLVQCGVASNATDYVNCQKENWYFHLFGARTDVLFDRCYPVQEAFDNKRPHQQCNGTCQRCGGL